MVDTGSQLTASAMHDTVRSWSDQRLNTAVFSHGHIDHVFGVRGFENEAAAKGWEPPRIVAHENLPKRFDRYVLTHGYNQTVNRRQFGFGDLKWPKTYRYPDETYVTEHVLDIGGLSVNLRHEKGETDDATVTWLPSKKVLCTGDMFIWTSPNAGNPQKVQRYPLEWAQGLRRMIELGPEFLLPGHGLPIIGKDRITQALSETAEYLENIVEQVLTMMNAGARLSDIVSTVKPPAHLLDRPYLQPLYDEPEFIVHNIWRLYGGWWDGNPANLKPANERAIARELAELACGPGKLSDRAEVLLGEATDDSLRMAGHLIEMAWLANPSDEGIQSMRQRIFKARADAATSTMSRGVFNWAVRESTGEAF